MRTILIAAAASLASASALAQAPAATGNAVADAFLGSVDAGYDNIAAGAVRDEGGATVLSDVSGTSPAGGSLTIGTVRIENGTTTDGGLSADRIVYENLSDSTPSAAPGAPAQRASVGSMIVTGARFDAGLNGGAEAGPALLAGTFDNVAIENVSMDGGGAPFTLAAASIALSGETGARQSLDFDLTDLKLVMSQLEGGAELAAMGYDELLIDVAADGAWDPAGTLDVSGVTIAGERAGTLTMSLGADGVTEQTMTQLAAAAGDFGTILGLTQAMNLRNLTLSYDDEGLVDRLLDRQAQQQGVERGALVSQSVAGVEMGLGQLNMPEFAATVSQAVGTFLAAPGTLTISAAPDAAVPLAQVIGGAMMAPQSLPTLLNLKVSATQ